MMPTRWSMLVVILLVAGIAAYFVTRSSFDDLPTPKIYALLWLVLLAIAEFYVAIVTRARLGRCCGEKGRTQQQSPAEMTHHFSLLLAVLRRFSRLKQKRAFGATGSGRYGKAFRS